VKKDHRAEALVEVREAEEDLTEAEAEEEEETIDAEEEDTEEVGTETKHSLVPSELILKPIPQ
jgi:hypothetical protein